MQIMKDSKSILLLVVSVLLLLVSFALLWTWGYQFSNFTKEKSGTVYIIKDSTEAANATRDSLRRVYTATIAGFNELDSTWTKADSLKTDLDIKLSEFYKLRNEIGELLKNPASKEDIATARIKINELQVRVDALKTRNTEVEQENKRLQAMIEQLRNTANNENLTNSNSPVTSGSMANTREPSSQSRPAVSTDKNPATNIFSTSDLRIAAMMVDEGREMETTEALQTDKIMGTFVVKNSNMPINSAEVYVVLVQPNGKVLQNSAWDAGAFQTKEGRKIYSCKLRFDYSKGEPKKLSFSLSGDKFEKGNYTMQLYHNGMMIGKATKTLI